MNDRNMLVAPSGRERTAEAVAELMRSGGFSLNSIIPTASSLSIIEGVPV